jgi:hypothetical protein
MCVEVLFMAPRALSQELMVAAQPCKTELCEKSLLVFRGERKPLASIAVYKISGPAGIFV